MNKSLRSLALRLRASLPLNSRLAALCLLALLIASASLSSNVSGQDKTRLRQEVGRALKSYDVLSLDARAVRRRVRQAKTLSLPTSAGTFDLVLEPNDILAPNYRATAVGDDGVVRELARPSVNTYKGTVRGMKGAQARLTIDGETVEGMIITPGENYFIEPAAKFSRSAGPEDFVFYAASEVIEEKFGDCGVTLAEEVAGQTQRIEAGKGGAAFASGGGDEKLFGPSYRVELATEADFEYFQAFGSAAAANNNIITIINQVNGIYETQIGLNFLIVHQHVWGTAGDPYTSTDPEVRIDQFRDHWNASFTQIQRDLAHMWTGVDLDDTTIGIASQPGLDCNDGRSAYGLSQNITNGSNQRRSLLTAHEIGHNLNAAHTNGVTACDNSIMSPALGSTTLPNFCQLSRDQITDHSIQNTSCLTSLVAPGCTYALSASVQSFAATGGSGSFSVSATGGCNWGVAEGADWITVTSGDAGSGNGAVNYTVAANAGGPRSARVNVGGQILTVTQQASANCGSTTIATGQTLSAALGSPDCRSGQTSRPNAFIDVYTFGASAGQQARIEMNASTPPPAGLDTYLYLYGPNGALVAENDDIVLGQQTNSRIPDDGSSFLTLPSTGTYTIVATSYDNDETGNYTLTLTGNAQPPVASTVQFSVVSAAVTEGADGRVDIAVTRAGDPSQAASVEYATSNGTASDRSDYLAAYGTLRWAAGDSSPKTFSVFVVDDAYGNTTTNGQSDSQVETFSVSLANPAGATLGATNQMQVSITNNEAADGANPVRAATFSPAFFVRQHYLDFFNREPDAGGLAFWVGQTTGCGNPDLQVCRNNVSGAFFVSIEFQETGYFVYKMYQAAYGVRPNEPVPTTLREFLPDLQQIGRGVVIGQAGAEAQLEANKEAYAAEFAARARFAGLSAMTNAQFIDALNANTEFSLPQAVRDSLVSRLNSGAIPTKAAALREVAENAAVNQKFFTRAFVLMQYYGYLRRNPYDAPELNLDFGGYNFWLTKLNQFGGNHISSQMVQGFITSGEYERRFGP